MRVNWKSVVAACLIACFVSIAALVPSRAIFLTNPYWYAGCDASGAFLSQQSSGTDADSYTWNSISVGSATVGANCARVIVAIGGGEDVLTTSTVSLTVGGVTADDKGTERQSTTGADCVQVAWGHALVSGTTANFVMTFSGSDVASRAALKLWRLEVTDSTIDYQDGDSTQTSGNLALNNVTRTDDSYVVAGAWYEDGAVANSCTWTGSETCTENVDAQVEAAPRSSGYSFASTVTNATDDMTLTGSTDSVRCAVGALVVFD